LTHLSQLIKIIITLTDQDPGRHFDFVEK
jgi:hypothetical protein